MSHVASAQGSPGGAKTEAPAAAPSKGDTATPSTPGATTAPAPGGNTKAPPPKDQPKAAQQGPDTKAPSQQKATDTKQAPATPPAGKDAPSAPAQQKATDTKQPSQPAPAAKDTKGPSPAADGKNATGAAPAGNRAAAAAPPPEKRTEIVSTIKQVKVEETTNVNFNISVGVTVPTTVRYHPLPSRIIEIYPEWRGYEFILVRGRYIIVEPSSHVIVYIIEG